MQDANKYKWFEATNCIMLIFHHIGLKMEEVAIVVNYDGDVVSTSKEVLFECPNSPKFIKISEEMSFVALRKVVIDVIEGGRRLFEGFFYHKHVYVGVGCVEFGCMELKDNNQVWKMFFIFLQISSKGLIELYSVVGRSPEKILVLLCKPRKPRLAKVIIALMCGLTTRTSSNED